MNDQIIESTYTSTSDISVDSKDLVKSRRTKRKSGVSNDITFTDNLAIPTFKPYQYAMSLYQHGQAYLQGGIDTSNLKTREGKLFFEDPSGISELRKILILVILDLTGFVLVIVYCSVLIKKCSVKASPCQLPLKFMFLTS